MLLQGIEQAGMSAACYCLFGLGVVLLFAKPRLGVLYYIAACLLSTDTPFLQNVVSSSPLISIHTVGIGGMSIMPLWTLLVLAFCLLFVMQKGGIALMSRFDRIILYWGGLFLTSAIIGMPNLLEALRVCISDASWYINTATAYLAVRLLFQREKDLKQLSVILVSCLAIRAISGIVFYLLGIGEISNTIVKPVLDSCRVLFPLLVLLGISVYYLPNIRFVTKIIFITFAFAGIFNVLIYASRGSMIFLVFSMLLLSFFLRKPNSRNFEVSRKFKRILIPSAILITITLLAMHFFRPGSINYAVWKLQSTTQLNYAHSVSSAGVRWLEFLNIFVHLLDGGNIIWGEGLGGYFTDNYIPFAISLLDGNAFPNEWILQNTLYKPHGSQLFILLKMGVGGAIIYFTLLLLFFIRSWKAAKKILNPYWYSMCVACVVFLPLFYYKSFNSKLQISMGIVMAVIVNIIALHERRSHYKF